MGHRRHQGIACHSAPIGTHHKRGDRVSEEHQHQPFEYAGKFAATLFTVGIVGVGFLAIPTLAGSAAYSFAETLGWRQGLDKKLKQARAFYTLIFLSNGGGRRTGFRRH